MSVPRCEVACEIYDVLGSDSGNDRSGTEGEVPDVDNSSTQTVTGQHQPVSGLFPENPLISNKSYGNPDLHLLESLSDVVSSQLDHSVSTSNNSTVSEPPKKRHLKEVL